MPDPAANSTADAPAASPLQRVCAELIVLRERNDRQHRLFEQTLTKVQEEWQQRFSQFAADTQAAYQRLREELTGEKRYSLAVLNALVDAALDIQKVAAARPALTGPAGAWAEGVAVAARRAEALLAQFGVHRYDAEVGSAYQPALHERIGSKAVEGVGPHKVAVPVQPGYASQQPDFLLRRAKVLTSE